MSIEAPEGFTEEVTAQFEIMHKMALRYKRGNPRDAEDLVQEALLRMWQFQDRYTPGTNIRAWALSIMHNLHVSELRRPAQRQAPTSLDALTNDGDSEPNLRSLNQTTTDRSTEDAALQRIGHQNILQAIAAVRSPYREVLQLVDVRGLSYQEAATDQGVALGLICSRLHRGRRIVAAQLRSQSVI